LVKKELLANSPTFQAINYDGLSIVPDGTGSYTNINTWRYRFIVLRMSQISDIFRGVFGDAAMPGSQDVRIRPLYEWQYNNINDTARIGLTWADRYFNKTDPASTFAGTASVQGGLTVGQSLQVSGNVGSSGSVLFQNATNSTSAFQVQNATGAVTVVADRMGKLTMTVGAKSRDFR